jgi:hypothetical protein
MSSQLSLAAGLWQQALSLLGPADPAVHPAAAMVFMPTAWYSVTLALLMALYKGELPRPHLLLQTPGLSSSVFPYPRTAVSPK